jgi:hypothetical protein
MKLSSPVIVAAVALLGVAVDARRLVRDILLADDEALTR